MKISIVIPTLNSEKTIEKCLNSLQTQTLPPQEIIIVDGGSVDATIEKVRRFNEVKLIKNTQPDTPGSARNKGAEKAIGDIIFFCDSDCIADERVLEYHLKAYKNLKDVCGVMGAIRNASPKNMVSDFVQRRIMNDVWLENVKPDGTIKKYFYSANFTIKTSDFLLEKFNEDLISAEDADLFYRLKKKELKIFFEPRAVVHHFHPTTVEQLFKQYFWYGQGSFQLQKLHEKDYINQWQRFSPARYLKFDKAYLYESVFQNNSLLCKGCVFNSFQNCHIQDIRLIEDFIVSEVNLHRLTCLATAAGILKQRTGSDYELIASKLLEKKEIE